MWKKWLTSDSSEEYFPEIDIPIHLFVDASIVRFNFVDGFDVELDILPNNSKVHVGALRFLSSFRKYNAEVMRNIERLMRTAIRKTVVAFIGLHSKSA